MKHIKRFLLAFRAFLESEMVKNFAKGAIYGNIVNSNGGGVYTKVALW